MEQYLNAQVKRYVQTKLFSNIKSAKTILGLAGTHPEKYVPMLPEHKQVILVDYNPINSSVRRNSLVGEFDLYNACPINHNPITFVDCDFCKSIVSCGDDMIYIYNKMKKSLVKNQYIAFTFSIRGVGLEQTLEWLSDHFEELDIRYVLFSGFAENCKLINKQYVHRAYAINSGNPLNLYLYRDSGDNMLTGIFKLKK